MKTSAKAGPTKKPRDSKPPRARAVAADRRNGTKRPVKTVPESDTSDARALPAVATEVGAKERIKLVRDSFTMPRDDFDLIATLKSRALEFKRPTKKSELLRAGLQQLAALTEAELRAALGALRPLSTGRPKKKR